MRMSKKMRALDRLCYATFGKKQIAYAISLACLDRSPRSAGPLGRALSQFASDAFLAQKQTGWFLVSHAAWPGKSIWFVRVISMFQKDWV